MSLKPLISAAAWGLLVFLPSADAFWHGEQACSVSKNIVTDYGAVGSGLVDDSSAFTTFLSFAQGYAVSNPGSNICLNAPGGDTFFFGTFVRAIFDGIPNFAFNANGSTLTNYLKLTTNAPTSAGDNTLHFVSVPTGVQPGFPVLDLTNAGAIVSLTVLSTTSSTVVLSGNASSTVSSGDLISFGGGGFFLGTNGQVFDAAHSATVNAVSVGATSVTLTNTANASIYSAGVYGILAGVDQQGFGDPQNPGRWEYVLITNVNSSTGVISFQFPTQYAYEATWPQYAPGCNTGGGPGCPTLNLGGPATLYVMPASWNVTQVYNNLSVDIVSNGTVININGKSITCNNCTFKNWGPDLAQQMSLTLNNPNLSGVNRIETDKVWVSGTINGGTVEGFFIQSASTTGTLTLNGVHVTGSISGATGTMAINNSAVDGGWQIGAVSYGQTGSISCSNSVISGGVSQGGFLDPNISNSGVTMSGGLLTVPLSVEKPVTWATPGVQMVFNGGRTFGIPFTVTDLTADATNTYVQTSLSGGFPSALFNHNVSTMPSRNVNFSGCTGSTTIVDWSQAGARNAKPYTYSHRIYTCTNNVATIQAANPGVPVIDLNSPPTDEPIMAFAIQSMSIAVSPADTSANATVSFNITGEFHYPVMDSTGATADFVPQINLKAPGTRSYNGTSWSNAQTGDTDGATGSGALPTTANPGYMTGPMQPFMNQNISGEAANVCPVVTVTIQTQ